jgi:hypothetical protein
MPNNCLCGHSEGVHFHTSRHASCGRPGCMCIKYRPIPSEQKGNSVESSNRIQRIIAGKPTDSPDVGSDLLVGTHVRDRTS